MAETYVCLEIRTSNGRVQRECRSIVLFNSIATLLLFHFKISLIWKFQPMTMTSHFINILFCLFTEKEREGIFNMRFHCVYLLVVGTGVMCKHSPFICWLPSSIIPLTKTRALAGWLHPVCIMASFFFVQWEKYQMDDWMLFALCFRLFYDLTAHFITEYLLMPSV